MSHTFFSIIIPALNEEKLLPKLLSDLANQTFTDFDVTVVDGRSEDKTPEIVRTLAAKDKRFKLLISGKRNVGHQRNLGGRKSRGRYLLFLDADDRIPTFFLSGIHYHCAKRPTIDGFTSYMKTDTDNTNDMLFASFTNAVIEASAHLKQPYAYGAFIGCKREVFEQLKGFDEEVTFGEDTDFVHRIVKAGFRFTVFREPTFTYSLRRFRKEGTLRLIRNIAPVGLKNLKHEKITNSSDVYPMLGGTYFEEPRVKKHTKRTIKQLEVITKTLREILTS